MGAIVLVLLIIHAQKASRKALGRGSYIFGGILLVWVALISTSVCGMHIYLFGDLGFTVTVVLWYAANYVLLYSAILCLGVEPDAITVAERIRGRSISSAYMREFLTMRKWLFTEQFVGVTRLFVVMGLLVNLVVFGLMIYGFVPTKIGGGRPVAVRFLFRNSDSIRFLPFTVDSNFSSTGRLLDVTDRTYLTLVSHQGKDKLFEFNKDLVRAVIYGVEEELEHVDSTLTPAQHELEDKDSS